MLIKKDSSRSRKGTITIGGPVFPGSKFYPTARTFRDSLDRLGTNNAVFLREIITGLTPLLEKLRSTGLRQIQVGIGLTAEYEGGEVEKLYSKPVGAKAGKK